MVIVLCIILARVLTLDTSDNYILHIAIQYILQLY